jgi:hypothetical protein
VGRGRSWICRGGWTWSYCRCCPACVDRIDYIIIC